MKTKYIEGTKEKYSITELGSVFSHAKGGSVALAINNNSISLDRGEGRKRYSIRRLLLSHFNIFYCNHCQEKCTKYIGRFSCSKCRLKQTSKARKKHYYTHTERVLGKIRAYKKKGKDNLSDAYVTGLLECLVSDNIPQSIIEAKRVQVKLHRQSKY